MRELTSTQIENAYDVVSPEILDLIYVLDGKSNNFRKSILLPEELSERQIKFINSEIKYVLLGLVSLSEVIDDALETYTDIDEDIILAYIQSIFSAAGERITISITRNKVNAVSDLKDLALIDPEIEKHPELRAFAPTSKKPLKDEITKESLLAEIESVNQVIAPPKSRPSTMEVLNGVINKTDETSKPTTVEAAIIDPFKKPEAPAKTEEGAVIFDPFKIAEAKPKQQEVKIGSPIYSNPMGTMSKPVTPATEIKQNLENKLNSVASVAPKQIFKSADPYRESIDSK